MSKTRMKWLAWTGLTLGLCAYLSLALTGEDKSVFLPGTTSHGHYQIELACDACHREAFGGADALQSACVDCHGGELKAAKDSHPKSKFTDPRNADRLTKLEARYCITCHVEHRPDITGVMGLTLPEDVCIKCHEDIAEDRPSHRGMDFFSCAEGGCHNYHDNRALYEDFLVKHAGEEPIHPTPRLALAETGAPARKPSAAALSVFDQDAPRYIAVDDTVVDQWSLDAHAENGVNCSGCHQPESPAGTNTAWEERPGIDVCKSCHRLEAEGFLGGRHGMRVARGMTPMTPARARAPMQPESRDKPLGCASCHGAHDFDTRHAAADGCLACHADDHSVAYRRSPHFRLWRDELAGRGAPGSGVSCATCHLPREAGRDDGGERIFAQHNQNLNLRPNEKMIRGVCMNCHGLAFSIDALADPRLVGNNFDGRPARHVASIDMAVRREKTKKPNDHSSTQTR